MKIITPSTQDEFDQYYDLRWRVLRAPWGQQRGTEKDDEEDIAFHLMAIDNKQALGVARLQTISPTEAQLRYMAVDTDYNGRGIGKAIVETMEEHARNNNIHSIMLHARENAVGFYEKMGFKIQQKSYLLFDCIQHYVMKKEL